MNPLRALPMPPSRSPKMFLGDRVRAALLDL